MNQGNRLHRVQVLRLCCIHHAFVARIGRVARVLRAVHVLPVFRARRRVLYELCGAVWRVLHVRRV